MPRYYSTPLTFPFHHASGMSNESQFVLMPSESHSLPHSISFYPGVK